MSNYLASQGEVLFFSPLTPTNKKGQNNMEEKVKDVVDLSALIKLTDSDSVIWYRFYSDQGAYWSEMPATFTAKPKPVAGFVSVRISDKDNSTVPRVDCFRLPTNQPLECLPGRNPVDEINNLLAAVERQRLRYKGPATRRENKKAPPTPRLSYSVKVYGLQSGKPQSTTEHGPVEPTPTKPTAAATASKPKYNKGTFGGKVLAGVFVLLRLVNSARQSAGPSQAYAVVDLPTARARVTKLIFARQEKAAVDYASGGSTREAYDKAVEECSTALKNLMDHGYADLGPVRYQILPVVHWRGSVDNI